MRQTGTLTVGDPVSEGTHNYTSPNPGAARTLTATYEGDDGPQNGLPADPVTATLRASACPVSFRLAVDPADRGVVLRRTSDQQVGYQTTEVYVDGQDAGLWQEPLSRAVAGACPEISRSTGEDHRAGMPVSG